MKVSTKVFPQNLFHVKINDKNLYISAQFLGDIIKIGPIRIWEDVIGEDVPVITRFWVQEFAPIDGEIL